MRRGIPKRLYVDNGAVFRSHHLVLRYDPSKRGAPIDVWHGGKKVHTARVVDAYANCLVKRNHGSKLVEPTTGANVAPPALRMSDMERRGGSDDDDNGGAPCT
jgi:hypothetical protein